MPQLINRLAELTGFRNRDQLDVSVVHAVCDLLRPELAVIYRPVGEEGDRRWLTRARMRAGDAVPSADALAAELASLPSLDTDAARAECLRTARQVVVGDAPQTSHFPICTEREVIGVLDLTTPRPLAAKDRAMVAAVLRIFGNFHDLLDHSERDPLTGLLNRQSFTATLLARTPSADGPAANDRRNAAAVASTWIGIVDIDFFKRVNDGFGHPIGDEVLLLLSRLLRSTFRHFDRLYRFGGEEFVVVLDCATAEHAAVAFERLRANVEAFAFPQVGRVTISTGFTAMTALDAPADAVARADKALYHVKQNGRNGVAQYEQLVAAGQLAVTDVAGDVELF